MWMKGFVLGSAALSLLGSGLTAAHYTSHAYARFSDRMVATAVEFVDAKFDKLAALRGYERHRDDLSEYDAMIVAEREALARGMNPALARAIVHVESNKKQFAISPVGALGFMQIMPSNTKRCGLKEPGELLDKVKNIRCGVRIIDEDIDSNGGDVERGLWNYNGGPNAVKTILKCGHNVQCMGYKSDRDKGYAESYYYARNVMNKMAKDTR